MGTIETCNVGFDSVTTVYPPVAIFSLPYLFKDIPHVQRVLQSEAGQKVLDKMVADVNLRLVGVLYRGPRHLMSSKKAVYKPADLNGQKIRVPGNPLNHATLKAMGATPVPVDWGEIYTALSQKLVDGYENPIDIFYESKGHETMKYLSFTGHMQSPIPIFVSEQLYQSLAPELREAIMKGGKAAEEHRLELLKTSEANALKAFKEAGIESNEVDFAAFQEATKDIYKEFVDKFGEDTYQAIKAVE
jgi:tripartite ATP-independent transporter DctP family solute receptor